MKHFLRNALQIEQYGFDLLKILFLMIEELSLWTHAYIIVYQSKKPLHNLFKIFEFCPQGLYGLWK